MKTFARIFFAVLILAPLGFRAFGCSTDPIQGQIIAQSAYLQRAISGYYAYTEGNTGEDGLPIKYQKSTWTGTIKVYSQASSPDTYDTLSYCGYPIAGAPGTTTWSASDFNCLSSKGWLWYGNIGYDLQARVGFFSYGTIYGSIVNVMGYVPEGIVKTATSLSFTSGRLTPTWATNGWPKIEWNVQETLSQPFTISMGKSRGELTATPGNSPIAYSENYRFAWVPPGPTANQFDTQGDGIDFHAQRVKFSAVFERNALCPGDYILRFKYTSWNIGSPRPISPNVSSANFENEEGKDLILQFPLTVTADQSDDPIRVDDATFVIPVPAKGQNMEITSVVAEPVGSTCPTAQPGDPNARISSVDFSIGLGNLPNGRSAGQLSINSPKVQPELFSPACLLNRSYFANGVEVRKDATGLPTQIVAPQCVVDVTTVDASGYTLLLYRPEQKGSLDPQTGRYALSGTPYNTYRIESSDGGATSDGLTITQTHDGKTKSFGFTNSGSGGVGLTTGDGTRVEFVDRAATGEGKQETRRILDSAGKLVSERITVTKIFPFGEYPVEVRDLTDPSGSAYRSTATSYYEVKNVDGAAYGHVKEEVQSEGGWTRYTYDTNGYEAKVYRPYLNTAPTWADSQCRVTETVRTNLADLDHDAKVEALIATIDRVKGTETGRSYRLKWSNPVTFGGDSCMKVTSASCTKAGVNWDDASNLVSTTYYFASGDHKGEVRAVINPNGTAMLTSHALDAEGRDVVTQDTGAISASNTVTRGTRVTSVRDQTTGQTLEETALDIASGTVISASAVTSKDAAGRPLRIDYTDGSFIARAYACCGLDSETDRNGVTTNYEYDSLGRLMSTTRAGLTTINTYDPAGRILKVTRRGSDGSSIVLQSNEWDLAGRQSSSTDAIGRRTTFDEHTDENGQLIRTTHTPVGDRVEITARDGSAISVGGVTAAPVKYVYGIDTNGVFTEQIRTGAFGEETEWTKVYTDLLGREFRTVYPDGATASSYFNSAGQVVRQVDPDGVQFLFQYDDLGERVVTAVDLNRDGIIDFAGADRITRTTQGYVAAHDTTVRRVTTEVWDVDNADSPRVTSVADTSLSGLETWQTANGLTTHVQTIDTGGGGRTVTTIFPDNTTKVQVFDVDRLSTDVVSHPALGTLTSTVNDYDAHGRLSTMTDARAGTTTYTYYDDDRVHTVTTPDPDPFKSGDGYDPQTTTYEYDLGGRVWKTTLPDGGVVTNEYFPTGLVSKTWGARTYPQDYTYDTQGRVKTLKTWQNYAGSSGAATTTWTYDPSRGWLSNKRDANNLGPWYTYTAAGRLATRTWARGVTTTYGHNNAGDVSSVTYSDSTPAVSMTYDRLGRALTTTDAAGTVTRSYHASGQLQNETYDSAGLLPEIALARTFDSLDRTNGRSGGRTPAIVYGYDEASRLNTVTAGNTIATYTYVPNSALVHSVTLQSGGATRLSSTRTYDNLNRLVMVTHQPGAAGAQPVVFGYAYNNANQRTRLTREDESFWGYTYDALGQVTGGRKNLVSGDTFAGLDFGYSFDDIGNRLTATSAGRVATYTPNSLNQYTQRTVPGVVDVYGTAKSDATVTVTYPAGSTEVLPTDRQAEWFYRSLVIDNSSARYASLTVNGVKANSGTPGEDAVIAATRHAFVPATPEIFGYDLDGNLIGDGRWQYTWDGENRLIAMETAAAAGIAGAPRQRLEFNYDSGGRRIRKQVSNWDGSGYVLASDRRFIYDGWNMIAELDGAAGLATVRSFVWGLDLSGSLQGAGGVAGLLFASPSSGSAQIAACDGNGNVVGLVDAGTGLQTAAYEYGPFGEAVKASGSSSASNPFRFSTKFTDDESSLLYYGHRYFSPSTGRWLSRDSAMEQGGLNLFGMVDNDAVGSIDYLGRIELGLPDLFISVAKGAALNYVKQFVGMKVQTSIVEAEILGRALAANGTMPGPFKTPPLWGDEFTPETLGKIIRDALWVKVGSDLHDSIRDAVRAQFPKAPDELIAKLSEDGYTKAVDSFKDRVLATQEWSIFPKCNNAEQMVDVFINAETKIAAGENTGSVWTIGLASAKLPYKDSTANGPLTLGCLCGSR